MRTRRLVVMAGFLVALAPGVAWAAAPGGDDTGQPAAWDAWYGCWRATGEASLGAGVVCVLPGDDASTIRIVTVEDGAVAGESVLRADGVSRAVDDGGCTGEERAHWSRDGRRVFVRTELDCGGVQRVSTGVLALIAENEWIDAQALTVAGQHAARSIRYRAVRPEAVPDVVASDLPQGRRLALEAARLQAAAPLELEDIIEAAGTVAPPALEALLAARQQGYRMDARTLVRLEAERVPSSVIDLMVALSYPRTFTVQAQQAPGATAGVVPWFDTAPGRSAWVNDCSDVWYGDLRYRPECAYLFRYSRYGYGYGSRWGYSPWGYDPYGWNYGTTPVVIIGTQQPGPAESGGSLTRGQGYTRGGGASTGTARSRSEPGRSSAGAASSPSSSPSTSSGSTSSGSSSSGSGSDTGRTAQPRPGGGGGEQP
jgi:hypothetical protein